MPLAQEPELIANYGCIVGEAPLWHARDRRLYWVDAFQCRLYRYAPATGTHELAYQGLERDFLGGFTVQEDGALLLCMARGAICIWREGATTPLPLATSSWRPRRARACPMA